MKKKLSAISVILTTFILGYMIFIVSVVLINAIHNLILLTYCNGYAGLIVRMICIFSIMIGLVLAIILSCLYRKKHGKKVIQLNYVLMAFVISAGTMAYYDVVGTWKDIHSDTITVTCNFSISQSYSNGHLLINSPDKFPRFRMSLFERIYDNQGNVIFKPFHDKDVLSLSLYRRVWFSDDYVGALEYYPHTGTRVSITNIERIE